MVLVRRPTPLWSRMALVMPVALLVLVMAACNSDDPDGAPDEASGEAVESEDGTTETPEETEGEDAEDDSDDGDQESDDDSVAVEGATARQQKRIDSGKPPS